MVIETIDASPIMSLTQLTGHVNLDFCKTTTYRISEERGFENYTVPEKWALTPEQKRLIIRYQSKPSSSWETVIFIDECRIENNPNKQKAWFTDKTALPLITKYQWPMWVLCWSVISPLVLDQ